jgi:asparagine synthase (glutamine-hydrolysing)
MLGRLRGMFAFAIWDKARQQVWIVRDRMGVKPLYYTSVGGAFLFASEIKSLLEAPGVERAVHERAFYDFLTFLTSPAPQTMFKNIFKLPAGHTLTIDRTGKQTLKRYWQPFDGVSRIASVSENEAADHLIHLLRESIRYRMVSDVKFGVFLSGGVDSSTNVALMAEQMARPVETFSIGFKATGSFNELDYARQVASRFKTNHHERVIGADDFVKFLPQLVYHQDEPIADPVCVPLYYVAKLAKENGTTVCQVGEGADELFCGYPSWGKSLALSRWARTYQSLPGGLRNAAWSFANKALSAPKRGLRHLDYLRRAHENQPMFWGGAEAYQETYKERFLSAAFKKRLGGYSSYETIAAFQLDFKNDAPDGADELHWMTYLDMRLRLPELLLMRVDKMTMATAVEARVPFLDQEFIKMAMGLPSDLKLKESTHKYILKKAVETLLPKEVISRRKQGFGAPVNEWFESSLLAWSKKKILDFAKRTDYFDVPAMELFVKNANGQLSWFLLNFVLWHEMWIERREIDLP